MSSRRIAHQRDPILYETNKLPIGNLLSSGIDKMEWGKEEKILDHGCGTGANTLERLLPIAEFTNSRIYGLDNSQSMIDHAKENFSNSRIEYRTGELTSSPFGEIKFNKVFSLFTLHWIEDYREELKALHQHMAPNGQIFLCLKLNANFFELFRQLKECEKWGELARENLVIPKWLSETGENSEILKKALEEVGFKIEFFQAEEMTNGLKNPVQCADLIYSLNPFAKSLKEGEQKELQHRYHKFMNETDKINYHPSGIHIWAYDYLAVVARKV